MGQSRRPGIALEMSEEWRVKVHRDDGRSKFTDQDRGVASRAAAQVQDARGWRQRGERHRMASSVAASLPGPSRGVPRCRVKKASTTRG